MRTVKISLLLRTAQLVWSYKERTQRSFWDDLYTRLSQQLSPIEPKHESKGTFLHNFLFESDTDLEQYKTIVEKSLSELLTAEDLKSVVISVTEPDAKPQKKPEQAVKEEPAVTKTEPVTAAPQKPITQTATEPAVTAAPTSMAERAQRLRQVKDGLLQKVRGQRHAVDEVVQTIFECEMFSAHNPKRKGPLATFLFTGPSGVGKTFLAEQCGDLWGRKTLIVDMSEYSDNLANNKFNGDHGQSAVVTSFVRNNPTGIIVFDEIEKAHINTIHLFLQILDAARLMDHQIKKEVSFRDNIIIMTTNAGKSLYEDSTVCDLSGVPRAVILEALRTDINEQTKEPYFPACITTRMANGHVLLFNHLEPFSLMQILQDEIALQIELFRQSSGIQVQYDPEQLAALVLYNGGGIADARTLRGLARNILVRELQEVVMQIYSKQPEQVDQLKNVTITVETQESEAIGNLFVSRDKLYAAVYGQDPTNILVREGQQQNTQFEVILDPDLFKRRIRGVTDYVLIDPLYGLTNRDNNPNDIEDIDSEGMRMFRYVREFSPETPVYIWDTTNGNNTPSYDTLLARGARGVVRMQADTLDETLKELSFRAQINNAVYSLGRSSKFLTFNCAQYIMDPANAVLSFEKLQLRSAPQAGDNGMIARKGENNNLKFADIIGCKAAKQTLSEFCKALDDPRKTALSGKRMPKGVLLYGPPGTGKTMLAKAMANECKATFIPVSATSFFGPLVGQTEGSIQNLFRKARKYAPSVIFVDEVDAIGRRRTGSSSTAHNEDALNTFLSEMDGFVSDEKRPVFILAATNYDLDGDSGRVLDPAFVRRFDRKILIPLPDTDERYEFLVNCLKKHGIHFGADHEKILKNMAERTAGMSNADLEMMNAQFARGVGDEEPDRTKYMDALDTFRFGEINKMDPDHLRQTACHEAGHALVCRLCGTTPSFLTIVSRGNFGGFMESAGENKTGTYTYEQLMNIVCRCLAGRAAEIEVYGNTLGTNTGASSDIRKAKYYVKSCLKEFAMGDHIFQDEEDNTEAEKLIQAQYVRAQQLMQSHRQILEQLTDLLVTSKSLDQTQLDAFFTQHNI